MYFILTSIVTCNPIPMALFGWGWKSGKIKKFSLVCLVGRKEEWKIENYFIWLRRKNERI